MKTDNLVNIMFDAISAAHGRNMAELGVESRLDFNDPETRLVIVTAVEAIPNMFEKYTGNKEFAALLMNILFTEERLKCIACLKRIGQLRKASNEPH